MLEMAYASGDHGHAVVVAVLYAVIVANRPSGMYHGCDAGLVSYLYAVGEGEECI